MTLESPVRAHIIPRPDGMVSVTLLEETPALDWHVLDTRTETREELVIEMMSYLRQASGRLLKYRNKGV